MADIIDFPYKKIKKEELPIETKYIIPEGLGYGELQSLLFHAACEVAHIDPIIHNRTKEYVSKFKDAFIKIFEMNRSTLSKYLSSEEMNDMMNTACSIEPDE